MNSEKMKKAYPLSPYLEARLQNTLNSLPDQQPAGNPLKKRLALILTACLLLIGMVAIADSQWGILSYLRSMNEPTGDTKNLSSLVTSIHQTQTAYHTDVSISDAVFDGKKLAFSLEYKNNKLTEPVYIIVTDATVDDLPLRLETENDTPSHIWLPGIYFTNGYTQNGLFGTPQEASKQKTMTVSITVSLFKPLRPIKQLPLMEGEGDEVDRQADIQQAYDEGYISLSEDHINLPDKEMGELARKNGGIAPDISDALTALGLMERKDLTFVFTLNSSD